jgi:hypothetical protein
MMNWKGFGRKRPWYYLGIRLEGLRKARKTLSQDSRSPSRIGSMLTTRPRHSVVWLPELASKHDLHTHKICGQDPEYRQCDPNVRIIISRRFL